MLPFIFAEKNGIHIIDLNKTITGLEESAAALKAIAKSGKKIMFVATKKQAKDIVAEAAASVNMPFVTERWLGGMLTNFQTIRKSVKKMQTIQKMLDDGTMDTVTKKERLTLSRSKDKMEKVLGGIANMSRTPAALFIVDISHEDIALAEARRLGIATFAMVDTNSDPSKVDFAVPSNDDATKSIAIITNYMTAAIMEGLQERSQAKENGEEEVETEEETKTRGMEINEDDDKSERRGRGRTAAPGGAASGSGRARTGAGTRPGGGAGRTGGGSR